MPSNYQSLISQIASLQVKAEAARKKELAAVVAQIRELMTTYGITREHLFGKTRAARGSKATGPSVKQAGAVKYQNPETGQTWTGRGRAPAWIVGAADREAFAV